VFRSFSLPLLDNTNLSKEYALVKLREETKAYPELQDFDDEESGRDGGSTAPISSVGTPMPGGSGSMYSQYCRLKNIQLTFTARIHM
jgi:hypothetical protein